MGATGMLSVQLGSTPPLATPAARPGAKRGAVPVVGFRTSSGDEPCGSVKSSFKEGGMGMSRSVGRSFSSGPAAPPGPLASQLSIPKSAAFVKVEGFAAPGGEGTASPVASPPSSPQPKLGSSLLSRQLTSDGPLPGGVGLDEPGLLVQQLERAVVGSGAPVQPMLRPAMRSPRRAVPDDLLEQLQAREELRVFHEPLVARAFSISRSAHDGQYRASGDPAFLHCVEVARELAALGANETVVAAALLHDVLDDTALWEGQLVAMLRDDDVVALVKQVSHLDDLSRRYRSHPATSAEGAAATERALVSMMIAMHGADPRPLLIRLADRLHDMRTAAALPAATRNRLAAETMQIWAPLANRLGVWKIKAQLEDLAFRWLLPDEYGALAAAMDAAAGDAGLQRVVDGVRDALDAMGLRPWELTARRKNVWGVYSKMRCKGYGLERVADVRGVRVVVETKEQCYEALRAIQTAFEEDKLRFKNYIRTPKANNYQSLHAVFRMADGQWVEVQIRTRAMHYLAEYGKDAAHWTYKEGAAPGAGAGDDGREAVWAKYSAAQQVADAKCRPSGSPPDARRGLLESLVQRQGEGEAGTAPSSAGQRQGQGQRSGSSPKRDFCEYLKWSGQELAPHAADRHLVALVARGGLHVRCVPRGSSLAALLAAEGLGAEGDAVLVNRQVEAAAGACELRTGDIVEVYTPADEVAAAVPAPRYDTPSSLAVAPLSPRAPSPAPGDGATVTPLLAGNVVPLGGRLPVRGLRRSATPSGA